MQHMCSKRRVNGLFDLDPVLADERPGYEEPERGSCVERLQRCRLDYIGRRIKVRNKEKKCFETATIKHFREVDGRFKIMFPDGFRWTHLGEIDFLILDNWKWSCGWIGSSTMPRHLLEQCSHRAVMCKLGCGQKIFEVSERSERALRKTNILAMNPAKWLQTATSTAKLTHSIRLARLVCSCFIQNAPRIASLGAAW